VGKREATVIATRLPGKKKGMGCHHGEGVQGTVGIADRNGISSQEKKKKKDARLSAGNV